MRIYASNPKSQGAKRLAEALDCARLRHQGSRYAPKVGDVVINWGSGRVPDLRPAIILNSSLAVRTVADKLTFFRQIGHTEDVPEWTTSRDTARDWCDGRTKVVCRTILNGSGGHGIVIANTRDEVVAAPLYVKYVPKQDEYRVHVFRGRSIDVQRKAKRDGVTNPNWEIRNHDNGFVYIRGGINPPAAVTDVAIRVAAQIPELDFGAVDVIWNERQRRAYVLEINSAPGLEGQTVTSYAQAFRSL